MLRERPPRASTSPAEAGRGADFLARIGLMDEINFGGARTALGVARYVGIRVDAGAPLDWRVPGESRRDVASPATGR